MPLGVLTGLTASMTDADTVITSTPSRWSAATSARMSGSSLEAGVTAASWNTTFAAIASATRCAPSRSITPPTSPRAAVRKRATSGFCRLVMVTREG